MEKIRANDTETKSADLVGDNLEQLHGLLPEAFSEGKVDFEVLKQLLGSAIDEGEEKYSLNWHGKRRARQHALTPSTGTLRPCPEDSVDWDTTQNLMIEGDNLEVLKLLQKTYAGRVKLIYIDPPYNTGNALIYANDYTDPIDYYLAMTSQSEGRRVFSTNAETSGRFHTNWLNMMYPRLKLARHLLRKDGVLVCTIDENEHANLGVMLKDLFDEGTYEHVCVTIVHNPRGVQGANFSYTHEYAYFVFPSGTRSIVERRLSEDETTWSQFRNWGTESQRSDAKNCFYPVLVRDDRIIGFGDVCENDHHPAQTESEGDTIYVYPIDRSGMERKWRYARQTVESVRHLLRPRKAVKGYEIEIKKDFGAYRTVWVDKRYDANEYGTKIVNSLVPDSPFSFPKSLWNVYDCIQAVTGREREGIVLDFFAGSGTTGHAVLQLNKDDGGSRRYILVQLPEPIEHNEQYRTIAEVTKTRLRAAAQAIKSMDAVSASDLGFKVFKLDSTNIHAWEPDRENLNRTFDEAVEHLKADRTENDIIYELVLKLGLDLASRIETRDFVGKQVHTVGNGVLMACLATKIDPHEVEELAQGIVSWHEELNPAGESTLVFRDSAFTDDVAKTNLAAILQQHGLKNVRSI